MVENVCFPFLINHVTFADCGWHLTLEFSKSLCSTRRIILQYPDFLKSWPQLTCQHSLYRCPGWSIPQPILLWMESHEINTDARGYPHSRAWRMWPWTPGSQISWRSQRHHELLAQVILWLSAWPLLVAGIPCLFCKCLHSDHKVFLMVVIIQPLRTKVPNHVHQWFLIS